VRQALVRTSQCFLSAVHGRRLFGSWRHLRGLGKESVKLHDGSNMYSSTIFEQVLLNYRVILVVRVACRTAGHHRHGGVSLGRTRITGLFLTANVAGEKTLLRSMILA
jgi:hypothetical protein